MKFTIQKRLAASVFGCGPGKVRFDPSRLEDIKEAITKADIRGLIIDKAIFAQPVKGISRGRARERHIKKRQGRHKGYGSRKGKATARLSKKEMWKNKIRAQRKLIRELKEGKKISTKVYRELYMKAKGGFFRSIRHVNLYIKEHELKK